MADCDHIIGLLHQYSEAQLVTLKELKELVEEENKRCDSWKMTFEETCPFKSFTLSDYFDKRKSTNLSRFDYCPICGEKISWRNMRSEEK